MTKWLTFDKRQCEVMFYININSNESNLFVRSENKGFFCQNDEATAFDSSHGETIQKDQTWNIRKLIQIFIETMKNNNVIEIAAKTA